MSKDRKPLFVVPTPLPGLPRVTLFADTWLDHIVQQHPYMQGKKTVVQATVSTPSVIMPGTSNPNYVVFVNQSVTSSAGNPLTVMINPKDQIIVTALFNRTFKIIVQEKALWLPLKIK